MYNIFITVEANNLATKYATVGNDFDGMSFRIIARKMTKNGQAMNHATARNILHSALAKIAGSIMADASICDQDPNALALTASFQSAIGSIVQDLCIAKE